MTRVSTAWPKVGGGLAEAHAGPLGQGYGLNLELLGVGLPDLGFGLGVAGLDGYGGHPGGAFLLGHKVNQTRRGSQHHTLTLDSGQRQKKKDPRTTVPGS
jgi:hypothetical protein